MELIVLVSIATALLSVILAILYLKKKDKNETGK